MFLRPTVMDNLPDPALLNSPNINSVLKAPKPRVPLKDIMAAAGEEDNTAARKRRVSFANVNKIKEFSAGAESMVVCHTPAYEEPFSVSSDSSYPSGVDGWTPAKGQASAVYTEKENISIKASRMSTGMDLTSVVGHSVQNTRYSMHRMDLTEAANSHETYRDQKSGLSVGMDLTNVIGYPSQNTRYSVGGMDLTTMVNPHQTLVDHKTRFSMGMDFTGVIGHSAQSTRYSINGMDLTEAVNAQQTFLNQRSTRFSVGMDLTNVGNSINMIKYSSCNEMDLTEERNPHFYQDQSHEGGLPRNNKSMDDSDALELTEVINGVQFPAVSPKYRNDVSLTENVLYSVTNTRYSVNDMDMTKAVGSRRSASRRKSSRYSLVNMDMTETINNSCDDLEFTEVIGDPKIRTCATRNSLCEMDLTEGIVDEVVTKSGLSTVNMDHTSVVDNMLDYSADTESSMNVNKTTFNHEPTVDDKENIFTNHSLKIDDAPSIFPGEKPLYVESKINNMSLIMTESELLPKVTPQHVVGNENEHSHLQKRMPLKDNHIIKHELCKEVSENPHLNTSLDKVEVVPHEFKERPENSVVNESLGTNRDSKEVFYHEVLHKIENHKNQTSFIPRQNKSLVLEDMENESVQEKDTNCMTSETRGMLENDSATGENGTENKEYSLNTSHFSINIDLKNVDPTNLPPNLYPGSLSRELNVDKVRIDMKAEQCNPSTVYKFHSISQNEAENTECIREQMQEDVMDISVIDNICVGEHVSKVTDEGCSAEVEKSEIKTKFSNVVSNLNESVMNMSIESCSLIGENDDVENDGQEKNDFCFENDNVSVNVDHRPNSTICLVQEDNHQPMDKIVAPPDQFTDLYVSKDSSLNLSSRSLCCNKNITMTRGKIRSFVITPESSLENSITENNAGKNEENVNMKSSPVSFKTLTLVDDDGLNQSENRSNHDISSSSCEVNYEKRGKRSFEAALEPENDTEESPVKQICLSREEVSTEHECLSSVTAPSFLMNTLNVSNETVPKLDQNKTTAVVLDEIQSEPASSIVSNVKKINLGSSKKMSETKVECSLRMGDSLIHNMSENPLHDEVIDLCESSFDATTTEVRELINNSRYKTKNACDDTDVLIKQNAYFNHATKTIFLDTNVESLDEGCLNQIEQSCLVKVSCSNNPLNMDETTGTDVLRKEVENAHLVKEDPLPSSCKATQLQSGCRSKREKYQILGKNCYAAEFIPNFVEIQFSVDLYENVINVHFQTICEGCSTVIGEYLLKQVKNYVLPEKRSDLILHLQSMKKSYFSRLARNLNVICKYHNGSLKGDILTLEVANSKNHFWTFIDVNIKNPQYLNQTDITISKQKIGELKLSYLRKLFSTIERNEDQLLNFAQAVTELQYDD